MQPDNEPTEQGFVDEPLPDMPRDGDAEQRPEREQTAGTDDGEQDAGDAPLADEPTA